MTISETSVLLAAPPFAVWAFAYLLQKQWRLFPADERPAPDDQSPKLLLTVSDNLVGALIIVLLPTSFYVANATTDSTMGFWFSLALSAGVGAMAGGACYAFVSHWHTRAFLDPSTRASPEQRTEIKRNVVRGLVVGFGIYVVSANIIASDWAERIWVGKCVDRARAEHGRVNVRATREQCKVEYEAMLDAVSAGREDARD